VRDAVRSLSIGIALACLVSCDTSFNPSAAFQPRMVVYSILTADSDTQYVRVYSTYNPPDNDPTRNQDETSVQDAQVSVMEEGGLTFSFRAVTIPRSSKSRYPSEIAAYSSYPFRLERGKTYTLTVSSASMGSVTARTTVPGQGSVTPVNPTALANPCFSGYDFGLTAALSPGAKGFLARIYVDYLSPRVDGTYQQKRFEIPIRRDVISRYRGLYKEIYPHPMLRSTPASAPVYIGDTLRYRPEERILYRSDAFCNKVDDLYLTGAEGCVQFRQAVFYLIQFDAPLWNYYNVANMSQDKFSVRTDEPDYTDIKNGIGVFGSMTVDSTLWPYVPRIIPYHVPPFTAGCQ
jgi:hypothetical protein